MSKYIKLAVLFGTVAALNTFFFKDLGSIGWFFIYTILVVATFLVAAPKLDKTVELLQPGVTALMSIWLAYLASQRTQPEVVFVLSVGVIGGLMLLHDSVTNRMSAVVSSLFEVVFLPLRTVGNYLWSVTHLLIPKKSEEEEEQVERTPNKVLAVLQNVARVLPLKSITIGLVISVPVLFLLVSLLRGADPIFAKNLDTVFEFKGVERLVERVVFSIMLLGFLAPWFFAVAKKKFVSPLAKTSKLQFVTEWTVVMGLVAAVLATFAWIQWQYIFVPPVRGVELSQFGIATYSEYVQKGFNEFVFLSLFIQGLLWVGLSAIRSQSVKGKRELFAVQMIVWAEAIFILLAFFRRIWLYQSFHGLTLVRMYGGFMVAWVAIMALGLLGRHFVKAKWVRFELLATALLLVVMGAINPVRYVAEVKPPTVNDRVDYTYLSRLSSDGAAGWVSAYKWVKDTLHSDAYNQAVVDAAARKDLLYTPLVIKNVLRNKERLIRKYGTPEEQKAMAEDFTAYSQRQVEKALAQVNKAKELRNSVTPEGTVLSPEEFAMKSYVSDAKRFERLLEIETKLKEMQSHLATGAAALTVTPLQDDKGNAFVRTPTYSFSNNSGQPIGFTSTYVNDPNRYIRVDHLCEGLSVCIPGGFAPGTYAETPATWVSIWFGSRNSLTFDENGQFRLNKPQTSWEAYLDRNDTEYAAYLLLQKEVPLSELLDLQERFFTNIVKVSNQKQEDRSVSLDIDLDAPFLEPLYN